MKKAKRILVLIIVLAMLAGLILPVFVRGEELPEGAVYTTTEEEMEDVSAPEDQTVDEDSDSTENENNESVTGEIPGESSEPAETDENSEPAETDGNSEPADSDGSSEPAESDENSETAQTDENSESAEPDENSEPAAPEEGSEQPAPEESGEPAASDESSEQSVPDDNESTAADGTEESADDGQEQEQEEKEPEEQDKEDESLLAAMALNDAKIEEGNYIIHSAINDSFVLDIYGGRMTDKANVQLYTANGTQAQVFYVKPNGDGTYTITNLKSSKVLDAAGGKSANKTNVWQYKSNGTTAQKWRIVTAAGSYVEIRSELDNNATLDVYAGKATNKANVQLYKVNGTAAQRWRFEKVAEEAQEIDVGAGTYEIASAMNTAYVLDIYGGSTKAGANLQLYKSNASEAQQFIFTDMGSDTYTITNVKSTLAIQPEGESRSAGANVRQEDKSFTGIQKWTFETEGAYVRIRNSVTGLYLTAEQSSAANRVNIGQAKKKSGNTQLFTLIEKDAKRNFPDGMYTAVSNIDGMAVMEAAGGLTANGTNIQLGTQNGGNSQKFQVTYAGNGYYVIKNVNANRVLDVYGGKNANKVNVQLWTANGTAAQRWAFVKAGGVDGAYTLRSALGSRVLDVYGGKSAPKTNIQIYASNNTKAQQWIFKPTTKQSKGAYYPDISHYKPVEDWSLVRENCPFIISKATQGVGSNAMVDSTLESFIQGCEQNKIPYYLYVYLNVGNEKAQAEYLVSVCKPLVGSYFRGYALDIEAGNTASAVKEALDYIKTQSKKTLLYTNWSQYYTYKSVIDGRGADCAWWEARYGQNTGELSMLCHDEVDLHQYTSVGTCPGIGTGEVDMNRLTGTKPESWFTSP